MQNEANALHSEVMERQRQELVSEARDQLASIEQKAADEISRKNLLLNEQAAQAMSEQKSAQLHVHAQDHRIRELSAELNQIMNKAGAVTSSAEKTNADLQAARSELAEYRTQMDAMNQYNMDMKRMAESQKKDFEAEIAKLRDEQKQLIRSLKSQPLEGTPGLHIHYGPGKPVPQPSQPSRPIIEEVKSGSKPKHSSDDDFQEDSHQMTMTTMMTSTTREVTRTRRTRRKVERPAEEDPGADVAGILLHHLHPLHRRQRQVRILRVPLHERSKGPWSVLGLVIIRPKSLIGS